MQREDHLMNGSSGEISMSFFSQPIQSSSQRSISDFASPLSYSSIFFSTSSSNYSSTTSSTTGSESAALSASMPSAPTTAVSSLGSASADMSRLMREHQALLNRHKNCLAHLRKTFNEAETLRQENTNLRVANRELSDRLNLLIQATLEGQYPDSTLPPTSSSLASSSPTELYPSSAPPPPTSTAPPPAIPSVMEKFGGLRVEERSRERGRSASRWEGSESPTSVIENDQVERDVNRVTLPKSISVRSNGFLKGNPANPSGSSSVAGPIRPANRGRSPIPVDGPHKVYVRGGGDKKDGPVELEVYNQGMFKTELCNKWQETGACPYKEHCQFAHGIEELRPVLRHPRYKTEVCRMVLAGGPCPYGHRCHFRHALTEQEKLMVPLKLD